MPVMPVSEKVIADAAVAMFAAFGAFSIVLFADFAGPLTERLLNQAMLGLGCATLIALATLCSRTVWLAAVVMRRHGREITSSYQEPSGMGQRFAACDREQSFLMPLDMREWLPPTHLAWFVIDVVGEMELEPFYAAYRVDGRSRPPYDRAMMVALVLDAYARGVPSSRAIERACVEDVAFRVIAAQQRPDHTTIARFVGNHQDALAGLFGEVLTLCARSGLAQVGAIAIDGTKVQTNASRNENLNYEQLARELVERAIATDQVEDEVYGEARGDELPPEFATAAGRRGWLREAKKRLEAERTADPQPVPGDRPKRLKQAKRRLDEELWTEVRANDAYERYRARGLMRNGRRIGAKPLGPEALHAASDTGGPDQLDRPRLEGCQGAAGLDPGLQRSGSYERAAHHPGRRDRQRRRGLRPPRTDARRRPARTRIRRRRDTRRAVGGRALLA